MLGRRARPARTWRRVQSTKQPQLFSRRIARRRHLWWGEWPRWRALRTYRDTLHRGRERYTYRRRDDPDDAWRCCAFWQRTLVGKWNGREFAARHGCRLPALYWCGYAPTGLSRLTLPDAFVVRPLFGTTRRGVYVVAHGRELLRKAAAAAPALRRRILASSTMPWTAPTLVEEFVKTEDGRYELPVEYKCYTFGDVVAAIEVIERRDAYAGGAKHRYYTAAWEPFADAMNVVLPQAAPRDPPRCLDEMLRIAPRLGAALGTFMRIDFFSTPEGCVFNEFSSTPHEGYTPYADELLGALWDEKFPERT